MRPISKNQIDIKENDTIKSENELMDAIKHAVQYTTGFEKLYNRCETRECKTKVIEHYRLTDFNKLQNIKLILIKTKEKNVVPIDVYKEIEEEWFQIVKKNLIEISISSETLHDNILSLIEDIENTHGASGEIEAQYLMRLIKKTYDKFTNKLSELINNLNFADMLNIYENSVNQTLRNILYEQLTNASKSPEEELEFGEITAEKNFKERKPVPIIHRSIHVKEMI